MTDPAKQEPVKYTRLIPDNHSLRSHLNSWGVGDLFIGRVRMKPGEEDILMYLQSRGVTVYPSPLAQMLSRSKTMQARVFGDQMVPGTAVINDLHDLVELMSGKTAQFFPQVITKHDRRNGGMGVHLWSSLEDVFNQVSLGGLPVPLVIQPFINDSRDIRVVILDDYREAYWRHNPNNFRNNLHFGGRNEPVKLSKAQSKICDLVMERGRFPYGHLDLMVTPEKKTFLAEVSLPGGIKGAVIDGEAYRKKIDEIHSRFKDQAGL